MMKNLQRKALTAAAIAEYPVIQGYYTDDTREEILSEWHALGELHWNLRENKTVLISGFPGIGKSHFFNNSEYKVLDSDSSKFDKSKFPTNYIEHIKSNKVKADIILISSHKEVRDALTENKMPFILVYPAPSLKEEYIGRYKRRGNNESFIKLLEDNYDSWISELKEQRQCLHIELQKGEYLSDVLI